MKIPKTGGKNNLRIPLIGLGTWQLEGDSCAMAVYDALSLGYTHVDTAEVYGNENEVGDALQKFDRENIFVTSKVWPSENLDYNKTMESIDGILKRLKTDYIDLCLIHWPKIDTDYEGVFEAFKQSINSGKIKNVGVSNFTINQLKQVIPVAKEKGVDIVINQVEFHPYLYQKELLDFCDENGILITAYSPLARRKALSDRVILDLADKYNKTAAQIILRWELQLGLIVIPKASSVGHLKENLGALEFELEKDDMEKINNIETEERLINPGFANFD